MNEYLFKQSLETFNQFGYCEDPANNQGIIGDINKALANAGRTVQEKQDPMFKKGPRDSTAKGKTMASNPLGYQGPWAPYLDESRDVTGLAPELREAVEKDKIERMSSEKLIKHQKKKEAEERKKAEKTAPVAGPSKERVTPGSSTDDKDTSEGAFAAGGIQVIKQATPAFLRALQQPADGAAGQKHGREDASDGADKRPRMEGALSSADLLFGAGPPGRGGNGKEEDEEDAERRRDGEEEDEEEEGPAPRATSTARPEGSDAPPEPEEVVRAQQKDQTTLADEEETRLNEDGRTGPITVISGRKGMVQAPPDETNTFHGEVERDYQGRTYITPPSEKKNVEHKCFLPKKWIHTWAGHTAAVSAIRFFPQFGHILLSASLDGQLKIWDVYTHGKCLRTMYTHSSGQGKPLGVRDICFSNEGQTFLSCGYDRFVRQWDTETGQCTARMSNGTIPYCVKYYPINNNVFIVGCNDRKIVQWDLRSKHIVQRYDQHLGAINTVTFLENARRFVSSSDDKALRVWEWGIPVTVKLVAEPHMHSMPSVMLHPSGKWVLGQSMDNQIVSYSTQDRFRLHKTKRFLGHICAGYAIQVNTSADGRFVTSGDADGNLWIWDFKTHKMLKKIKAHDKVTIGCEWHPIEPSRIATASWDGTIKYWD